MVFHETKDSQVEQYDLDIVDDEEVPYEALQKDGDWRCKATRSK
jgi:hypothetical protein